MSGRAARRVAISVLAIDAAALVLVTTLAATRPEPAPDRGTVVESVCNDGQLVQGIDDGNPDGLLAYNTGVSC